MFRVSLALLIFLLASMAGCAASPVDEDTQSTPEAPPGRDQVVGMAPPDPAADIGTVRYWLNGSANITITELQVPGFVVHDGRNCRTAEAGSFFAFASGRLWATWEAQAMTEEMVLMLEDRADEFASDDIRRVSAVGASPLVLELEAWDRLREVSFGIEPVAMAQGVELWLVADQTVMLHWAIEYAGTERVPLEAWGC